MKFNWKQLFLSLSSLIYSLAHAGGPFTEAQIRALNAAVLPNGSGNITIHLLSREDRNNRDTLILVAHEDGLSADDTKKIGKLVEVSLEKNNCVVSAQSALFKQSLPFIKSHSGENNPEFENIGPMPGYSNRFLDNADRALSWVAGLGVGVACVAEGYAYFNQHSFEPLGAEIKGLLSIPGSSYSNAGHDWNVPTWKIEAKVRHLGDLLSEMKKQTKNNWTAETVSFVAATSSCAAFVAKRGLRYFFYSDQNKNGGDTADQILSILRRKNGTQILALVHKAQLSEIESALTGREGFNSLDMPRCEGTQGPASEAPACNSAQAVGVPSDAVVKADLPSS